MNIFLKFSQSGEAPLPNLTDCDVSSSYLKSIKNDPEILLGLFHRAIQDRDFWNTANPEIRNKLITLIYKMQIDREESGINLEVIENTKTIYPDIYPQIETIIKDYKYRKNLKLLINLVNEKSEKQLLDKNKVSHLTKDDPCLISFLIVENNSPSACIEELINIINNTKVNELNIEVLPYFLKIAQECGQEVLSTFVKKNSHGIHILMNKTLTIYPKKTGNLSIKLESYSDKIIKNFIQKISDLGLIQEIIPLHNLNNSAEVNYKEIELIKEIEFINKFKKYIKKICLVDLIRAKLAGRDLVLVLNNLKTLLKSGAIDEVEEIEFLGGVTAPLLQEISLIKNLKSLCIDFVSPWDLSIEEIKNLSNLENLCIFNSINEMQGIQAIENLLNLKSLRLNCYELNKKININFSQLRKLEIVNLSSVNSKNFPQEVLLLPKIKELYIDSSDSQLKIPLEKIFTLKNLHGLTLPNLTQEECLKIFFKFSGQIQQGLFDWTNLLRPDWTNSLRPLIQNSSFYFFEKKELLVKLGLLMIEIDNLWKIEINNLYAQEPNFVDEQKINQISQELRHLTVSIFEISDEQVALWMKYLNNEKLDGLLRLTHLRWFSNFLSRLPLQSNPFSDKRTYHTLQEISKLTDSSLRKDITAHLLSFYRPENEQLLNTWLQDLPQLKHWQVLPHLFLVAAKVEESLRQSVIEGLNNRNYRDSKKIKTILEILHLVIALKDLNKEDIEDILKLILLPLSPMSPKIRGETNIEFEKRKQVFSDKQKAFREKQLDSMNMIRNLINLKKTAYLKGLTEENLFPRLQQACKEIFKVVKQENVLALFDTFQSRRYQNGLITYAAGMGNLPENERIEFMQRLEKFIDDVIHNKFPESRYCTSLEDPHNLHLNTVFKMANGEINQPLLEKWKSSFIIDIKNNKQLNVESSTPPHQLVKDKILQALKDFHLGPDFKTCYPILYFLQKETLEIQTIKNLITHAERQLASPGISEKKQKFLNVEIKCLKLLVLDKDIPSKLIIEALKDLESEVKGNQFEQDLKDILALLQPKDLPSKFISIEDTSAWEDWLLMGTEVYSSCLRITGFASFNKALLSYIRDGKYKLIIVRDEKGRIAARCVLRILWDDNQQKPVLFMERLYTQYNDNSLNDYIMQGCIKKAQIMGLCLFADSAPNNLVYNKSSLSSLSSPNPYEYVDAEKLGIVYTHGQYTLKQARVIYNPRDDG